jgi:hypothetical protein
MTDTFGGAGGESHALAMRCFLVGIRVIPAFGNGSRGTAQSIDAAHPE